MAVVHFADVSLWALVHATVRAIASAEEITVTLASFQLSQRLVAPAHLGALVARHYQRQVLRQAYRILG